MDALKNKQSKIDRLEKRVARLLAENESLRKENESLTKKISVVDELIDEYTKLIDEISTIKERYMCALRDTIEMNKEFRSRFEKQIRSIRKV
jgi:regulator of replication initiation timing